VRLTAQNVLTGWTVSLSDGTIKWLGNCTRSDLLDLAEMERLRDDLKTSDFYLALAMPLRESLVRSHWTGTTAMSVYNKIMYANQPDPPPKDIA